MIKAESSGPIKKRLKTIDTQDDNCDNEDDDCEGENNGSDDKKGELFKHVKESKNEDIETLDAATTVCNYYYSGPLREIYEFK